MKEISEKPTLDFVKIILKGIKNGVDIYKNGDILKVIVAAMVASYSITCNKHMHTYVPVSVFNMFTYI